jgi:hypothetical protein
MLNGTVEIDGNTWVVDEERRAGPQAQLFNLTMTETPQSRMHVRPLPDHPVKTLEEVAALATEPSIRWFADSEGVQWETRMVIHSEPNAADVMLVKFISERFQVCEGPYPFRDGLGTRTDDELRELLGKLR